MRQTPGGCRHVRDDIALLPYDDGKPAFRAHFQSALNELSDWATESHTTFNVKSSKSAAIYSRNETATTHQNRIRCHCQASTGIRHDIQVSRSRTRPGTQMAGSRRRPPLRQSVVTSNHANHSFERATSQCTASPLSSGRSWFRAALRVAVLESHPPSNSQKSAQRSCCPSNGLSACRGTHTHYQFCRMRRTHTGPVHQSVHDKHYHSRAARSGKSGDNQNRIARALSGERLQTQYHTALCRTAERVDPRGTDDRCDIRIPEKRRPQTGAEKPTNCRA